MPTLFERLRDDLRPEGYEIEREIASGGMGTVFLAREVALDRPVAIKIIRPEMATAKAVERFLAEARILADIRHSHIVKVFRAGQTKHGTPYYAMEYLGDGETLAERMRREPLSRGEVVKIGRDLLDALETVHRRGVIHRDIKPQNIFLVEGDATLVDFGIAMPSGPQTVSREGAEVVPGTPTYMPPEHRYGWDVGPQTDIYAVGMVLYEALTGRRWKWFLPDDVPSWSGVPWLLRRPLRQALAFEVDDRWETAAAFRHPWWRSRVRKYQMRTLMLTVGALAAGLIAVLIVRGRPGPPVDVAIVPFVAAPGTSDTLGWEVARFTERTVGAQLDATAKVLTTAFVPSDDVTDRTPTEALERLHAGALVRGAVTADGQGLLAGVRVMHTRGETSFEETAPDVRGLACKLAPMILRSLGRASEDYRCLYQNTAAEAVDLVLKGEAAFRRQAWHKADSLYSDALEADSSLVWARYGRANANRWLREDVEDDLEVLQQRRSALVEVDRMLLDASLGTVPTQRHPGMLPFGAQRLERYAEIVKRFPLDPYPWLVFGDDLRARGSLLGLPRDSALHVLERAVERDSSMGPALLDLTLAGIESGDSAMAGEWLGRLAGVAAPDASIEMPYVPAAFVFRFRSERERVAALSALVSGVGGDPEALTRFMQNLRWALSLDLADGQLLIADLVRERRPDLPPVERAHLLTARGVALIGLGRWAEAVETFDTLDALLGTPASAVLAAQWRVLPHAIGLASPPAAWVAQGRIRLEALADDSLVGPRAAWSLAVSYYAEGDVAAAQPWAQRARVSHPEHAGLSLFLRALQREAVGDVAGALTITDTMIPIVPLTPQFDPFLRAATYLARGRWARALYGDTIPVAWRWHENSDFRGKFEAWPQAAEIDWALRPSAHLLTARARLERGPSERACRDLKRIAEVWRGADAVFQPLLQEARTLLSERCQ
jgi:tetratricopeptide (TPR) repeat protein